MIRLLCLLFCVARTCTSETKKGCVVDLCVIVDHSGSITEPDAGGSRNWNLLLNFIVDVVRQLDVNETATHVSSVSFGNKAKVDIQLDGYFDVDQLTEAIQAVRFLGGNTNTTGALRLVRQQVFDGRHGDRTDVSDVVVLLTDGLPTREVDRLAHEATVYRQRGIRIIVVGLTSMVNDTLMRTVIDDVDNDYLMAADFSALASLVDVIVSRICAHRPVTPLTGDGEVGVYFIALAAVSAVALLAVLLNVILFLHCCHARRRRNTGAPTSNQTSSSQSAGGPVDGGQSPNSVAVVDTVSVKYSGYQHLSNASLRPQQQLQHEQDGRPMSPVYVNMGGIEQLSAGSLYAQLDPTSPNSPPHLPPSSLTSSYDPASFYLELHEYNDVPAD